MIWSNIRDENTKFPSVFTLRHENSQMPCKALLWVGPAKLVDAVHSSLPSRLFQGRTLKLSPNVSYPPLWTTWQTDRPRPCPPHGPAERGIPPCTQKALTTCPRLSGTTPRGHHGCLCPLYGLRAESVFLSFLYCHGPALLLTHGKIPNWLWAKVIRLQNESCSTGRTAWYPTALFLTTLSGSKRCTLICSRGHEMGHTCFMCSKSLLDNVPCDMLLDG